MSENIEKKPLTKEEQKENNRFSFIVGIFIAMAVIALFVVFFN